MKNYINDITDYKYRKVIDISEHEYLKDHCVNSVVVLPGAFYCQEVINTYTEQYGQCPVILENITFLKPMFLSKEDKTIELRCSETKEGFYLYSFYDVQGENNNMLLASIIARDADDAPESLQYDKEIANLQHSNINKINSEVFYNKLHQNGNQYGEYFQGVKEIAKTDEAGLVKIRIHSTNIHDRKKYYKTLIIDALCQSLLAFCVDMKGICLLKEIKAVSILSDEIKGEVAAYVSEITKSENEIAGKIVAVDNTGKASIILEGVKFSIIAKEEKNSMCFSSNFTIEPIKDSLEFWKSKLKINADIEFSQYNQVFQQLLNENSIFYQNQLGLNILVLSLEEWYRMEKGNLAKVNKDHLKSVFAGKSRYVLPNNMEIVHVNKYETDYVYNEIFEEDIYIRHGISVKDEDTIVDIGANIGLFSLYINSICENAKIYSFEPSPAVFEVLSTNAKAYGGNIKAFNCGIADREKEAKFTFYGNSTVFSSVYSDKDEDKKAIQAIVRNMIKENMDETATIDDFVEELTEERLESKIYNVKMKSLSDIITENNIQKIDLLKLDAEKSELDVLNGIKENHWPMIKQIVMEIHDDSGKVLSDIEKILIYRGFKYKVEQDKFLGNSGLYNLYAIRKNNETEETTDRSVAALRKTVSQLCDSIRSYAEKSSVPLLVCFTPISPEMGLRADINAEVKRCEEEIINCVGKIPNGSVLESPKVLNHYSLETYYDYDTKKLGHIPYNMEYYTGLGSLIFRKFYSLFSPVHKVIVLDCDNTLWKGNCGEVGYSGIEFTEPYENVQKFVLEQKKKGVLICLCSKNDEEDVMSVFNNHNEFLLGLDDIVAWRINWNKKSDNIIELSQELNLGLDSFVFIDDSQIECAEVRSKLPQVLTVCLTQNLDNITSFLDNLWIFDNVAITKEDQNRTKTYKEQIERNRLQKESVSLKSFIKELELDIKISEPNDEHTARVSQLTYRTNQFNFTTIRRTEAQINKLIAQDDCNCLITNVKDKYGDYGLVGVIIYNKLETEYVVDTFLISCRVLGRGVEHRMLSYVANKAVADGKEFIKLIYTPTEKNTPALKFLEKVAGKYQKEVDSDYVFTIPAREFTMLDYLDEIEEQDHKAAKTSSGSTNNMYLAASNSIELQQIGEELSSVHAISKVIDRYITDYRSNSMETDSKPQNSTQEKILKIWKKVLRKYYIGLNDNFFDIGGSSLLAVYIVSSINKEFNLDFSTLILIECPTILLIAEKINSLGKTENVDKSSIEALQRGKRRNRIIRQ